MSSEDIASLEATCLVCLQTKPREDLDRLLWCDSCVADARARSVTQSWYVGVAVAVALVLWIWLYVQPSDLVIGGWIGCVVGAFYVSARVACEGLYAVARVRGMAADLKAKANEPAE